MQNDLNGSAPDSNPTAVLFVDVINDFDFPGGDRLLAAALEIAPVLRELKTQARRAGVPVIYANDNFGRWRSGFDQLVTRCTAPERPGHAFVKQIVPDAEDYLVLKPKHSAFFQTPLDALLKGLGTERLILGGLTTNSCILFTAHDAYMRDLRIHVPSDCVAAQTPGEHRAALEQMEAVTKADISPAGGLSL